MEKEAKAKDGAQDGIQDGTQGAKAKAKVNMDLGHISQVAKDKECREAASTEEKLDTQLGCAPSHRKEEEKEKE